MSAAKGDTDTKTAEAFQHGPVGNGTSKANHEKFDTDVETTIPAKQSYPWYIIFILGNEFCERFSYYGMKTVLTLYFLEVLLWSESTTTLVYHLFSVLCYFTPIFGAMLADGFLGKFNTIFSLSLVYVGGLVLLTLAAITPLGLDVVGGTAAGLILIGFGTGGIKPVVPAYGGDQFKPGQEKHRETFFSVFYFCINAGSLISTFLTPILRKDVQCFGLTSCYPLAFGLPAGLMVVALIAFLLGRPFYRNVPSKVNIIAKVFGVCFHALSNKIRKRGPPGAKHWLDNARDSYDEDFIKDVKQLLPVLKMFLPVPMFWALFDQQGSRWTLQATKMDGRITDSFYWKPDQVQIFNPVMILIMIPIFEGVIFRLLDKYKIPFKALARMTLGMVFAGLAFVIAGIIQMQLQGTLPTPIPQHKADINFYNTLPYPVNITLRNDNNRTQLIKEYDFYSFPDYAFPDVDGKKVNETQWRFGVSEELGGIQEFDYKIGNTSVHLFYISDNPTTKKFDAKHVIMKEKEKPKEGLVQAFFILPFKFNTSHSGAGDLVLINPNLNPKDEEFKYTVHLDPSSVVFNDGTSIADGVIDMAQGKYEVYFPDENVPNGLRRINETGYMELKNGGVYSIILDERRTWISHEIIQPSSLSIFLQLPQYFVMTVGEVLLSVSGLSFAYSQAPASMKSVLQAGWLMTVAFGNVIVIIISGAKLIEDQAVEFFVFAGLIGVAAIIFGIMARFYKYVDVTPTKTESEKEKPFKEETDSL